MAISTVINVTETFSADKNHLENATSTNEMIQSNTTVDGNPIPSMDDNDEIIVNHSVPFRFTRRRDRLYGFLFCMVLFVVVLSISLSLTRDNRKGNESAVTHEKDWTMIGDPITNSMLPEDEVLAISLALSDDGKIIAIGNRYTPVVRIYSFQNQSWMQMGSDLVGSDDSYGSDVALSGDGLTVAIGGPKQSVVQVFKFDGTSQWIMMGNSIRGDMSRGELAGAAISLSLNGRVIAVGAHLNSDLYQRSGQVRVFKLAEDDSEWMQMGSDINGNALGDQFGNALSLSNDGLTLAIGARFHDDDNTNTTDVGHVRVYRCEDDIWGASGGDIEGDEAHEGFGYSVSLSGDGTTCAIGNTNSELAVYRQAANNEWVSIGSSIAPTLIGEDSYAYVSLSRDGNVLAVLENRSYSGEEHHTVIIYKYEDRQSKWVQVGTELKGAGLALSADGSIVAVGGADIEGLEYVRILTAV
jgi:hypothetical protein